MAKFNPVPTGQVEDSSSRVATQDQRDPNARSGTFARNLESGIRSVRSLASGFAATGAALVGQDEIAQEQLQKSEEEAQAAAEVRGPVTDIRDVRDLSDIATYLQEVVGQQLPIMATLAVGGPTALTARSLAGNLIRRNVSKRAAATAGIVGSGGAIETGSIFPEVVREAEESGNDQSLASSAVQSLGFGGAAGALEALPVVRLFDKVGAGAGARNAIRSGLASRVARGAGEQALLEGGTEAAQTVIERSARKFVNDNFEIFDDEGLGEIINATAAGAILGGGLGGLGGAISPVDQEISDFEAENQITTARTQKQLDMLRDIPEAKGEIEDIETIGLDDPLAQEAALELGARYSRLIPGQRSVPALIRSKAETDISDEEVDAIRRLAVGDEELTAPVREALVERFGSDEKVSNLIEEVFSTATGIDPEDMDAFMEAKNRGLFQESILGDESGLTEGATVSDPLQDSGILNEFDISGVTQEGVRRNQPLVRERSGRNIPGVIRVEKAGQKFEVPSFNLTNRMLVKNGINPTTASTREIAQAWISGIASIVGDHSFQLEQGEGKQLKASDKIYQNKSRTRSVTVGQAMKELKQMKFDDRLNETGVRPKLDEEFRRIEQSPQFTDLIEIQNELKAAKQESALPEEIAALEEMVREEREDALGPFGIFANLENISRDSLDSVPRALEDLTEDPNVKSLFNEFIDRKVEAGELQRERKGDEVVDLEDLHDQFISDEFEGRFIPTRGSLNVADPEAVARNAERHRDRGVANVKRDQERRDAARARRLQKLVEDGKIDRDDIVNNLFDAGERFSLSDIAQSAKNVAQQANNLLKGKSNIDTTADKIPFAHAKERLGRPYITQEEFQQLKKLHAEEQRQLEIWSKKFGLVDAPVLVSPEEIFTEKRFLTRVLTKSPGTMGFALWRSDVAEDRAKQPAPGIIYIAPYLFDSNVRRDVMAHELGHLLLKEHFNYIQQEGNFDAMAEEFNKWRMKTKNMTLEQVRRSKMTPAMVDWMIGADSMIDHNMAFDNIHKTDQNYLLDFHEWFADNVALWLRQPDKEVKTKTDSMFKRFADMIKKLFGIIKEDGLYGARSVYDFLEMVQTEDIIQMAKKYNTATDAAIYEAIGNAGVDGDLAHLSTSDIRTAGNHGQNPYSRETLLSVADKIAKLPEEQRAIVARAFSARFVRKQIFDKLARNHVLLSQLEGEPALMMAAGYQLWLAGDLQLGPKTAGVFKNLLEEIYDVLGIVSDSENAEAIFSSIRENKMGEAEIAKATKDTRLKRGYAAAANVYDRMKPFIEGILSTADGAMHATENPFLIQIANMMNARVGEGENVGQSYQEAKRENIGGWINRWHNILNKLPDNDSKNKVVEYLQNSDKLKRANQNPKARRTVEVQAANEIKNLLRRFHKNYLTQKEPDPKNPVFKYREDYFPWVFDSRYMQENSEQFFEFLNQDKYEADILGMVNAINEERLDNLNHGRILAGERTLNNLPDDMATTKDAVIRQIINNIMGNDGLADVEIAKGKQHVPYMGAVNTRSLDFLEKKGNAKDKEFLAKFFSKNIDYTMTTYFQQAVKRAEYISRFGSKGEVLDELIQQARKYGATAKEAKMAYRYIEANLGILGSKTNSYLHRLLGWDVKEGQVINPVLRKAIGSLIVLQNLALLSMATFTSLVDPVGIAVRGGDLKTLNAAMKAGMQEAVAKAKGNRTKLRQLAEAMGTIESKMTNEALEWEYGGTWLDPKLKWANEQFFKVIGLTGLTRLTRIMGLAGAESFIKSHYNSKDKQSQRFMRELGLREGDVKFTEEGDIRILTHVERDSLQDQGKVGEVARDDRVRNALNRFVDEAILRPNAALRPIWASDPHFALIFHLKAFMYAFHDRILRRAVTEMDEGNVAPMLMMMLFIPAMMAADYLRDLVKTGLGAEGAFDKSLGKRAGDAVQRSGVTGLGQIFVDMQNDVQYGGLGIESLLGPTAQNLVFKLDDIMFNADDGTWDAIHSNLPFSNSLGIPIEHAFIDEAVNAADKQ